MSDYLSKLKADNQTSKELENVLTQRKMIVNDVINFHIKYGDDFANKLEQFIAIYDKKKKNK